MQSFDRLRKKLFGRFKKKSARSPEPQSKAPKADKSAKDQATERGEPWVNVIGMELDQADMTQGAFELDWNEIFVARLVKAGYMMKPTDTDAEIVDRWFQNVCRNVVLETWEQEQAMNPNRVVKSRDIGDGRREVS